MHYVYIIESISTPGHFYIGYTQDLRDRVRKHQAEVSSHAAKYRPERPVKDRQRMYVKARIDKFRVRRKGES